MLEYSYTQKIEAVSIQCKKADDLESVLCFILSGFWENRKYLKQLKESKRMYEVEDQLINLFQTFLKQQIDKNADYIALATKDLNNLTEFYACGIMMFMKRNCDAKSFDAKRYAHTLYRMLQGKMILFEG